MYVLACFGYKQQIADLEVHVQMNNTATCGSARSEILQSAAVPEDREQENALNVLLRQASTLSDLAEDPAKIVEPNLCFNNWKRSMAEHKRGNVSRI